jgi:hypothetical protein
MRSTAPSWQLFATERAQLPRDLSVPHRSATRHSNQIGSA